MRFRSVWLLLVLVAATTLAGCADVTAPRKDNCPTGGGTQDWTCR